MRAIEAAEQQFAKPHSAQRKIRIRLLPSRNTGDCEESRPIIFELDSGDFAMIGRDITDVAMGNLPASPGCGPDERIVSIPRKTPVLAKSDIPDSSR